MAAASNNQNFRNFTDYRVDSNFTTCVEFSKETSKSIIQRGDISNSILPLLMLQLTLVFLTSNIIYYLLRPLKQPKFVCNVLSGIILGRSVLSRNKILEGIIYPARELLVVNTLSIIGGILFVFINTVKMDKFTILRTIKHNWNVSLTVLLVPLTISVMAARLLHVNLPSVSKPTAMFYISFISSESFFAVVADAIGELNLLNSELGQLTISVAILHELLGYLSSLISPIVRGGFIAKNIKTVISFLGLLLFTIFFLRPAIQWIIRSTPERKPVKKIYICGILMGALVMSAVVDSLGLNFMMGASIMGLIIPAGPPLGSALVERTEIMISNFFMPFFFIRIGLLTDVFSIKDRKEFVSVLLIVMAANFGKVCGSFLSLICYKSSIRNALLFSCFLNIKGIIELMVFLRWRMVKLIDEEVFSTLVLWNLVLTGIMTYLISFYYKPRNRFESMARTDNSVRTLHSMLPNSELRILCCIHHEENVSSIINLLRTSNPSELNPICAYVVHLIDLIGRAAPLVIPYHEQQKRRRRRRVMPNSTDEIMQAVLKYSKHSGSAVTIQPFKMISPYNTMHQSVCKLVEDYFIPLIILPFCCQNGEVQRRSLQNFNNNVLAHAHSTVGIFFDRGLNGGYFINSCMLPTFCYNVGVFFLGGPDDREAMALVKRISSHHHGVSVTVFRIYLGESLVENEDDGGLLDDVVMNEFMAVNAGNNDGVVCREIMANDSKELMDAVKAETDYELVIVGRRHPFSSRLETEMKPWVEFEELGIIGDILASADFVAGRMMSLLVMQSAESIKGGGGGGPGKKPVLDSSNSDKFSRKSDCRLVENNLARVCV